MRLFMLPIVALFATTSASADEAPIALPLDNPAYSEPAKPWKSLKDAQQRAVIDRLRSIGLPNLSDETCRDRITRVRELLGKAQLLKREPASPDRPLLIYAVDRRQGGCSVMVMKGDPDDIRQLPLEMEGSPLMPAEKPER